MCVIWSQNVHDKIVGLLSKEHTQMGSLSTLRMVLSPSVLHAAVLTM